MSGVSLTVLPTCLKIKEVVLLGIEAFHYNKVEGCLCLCWTLLVVVVLGVFNINDGHGAVVGYFWSRMVVQCG
ncbi:hypothetical protein DEO72_LG2g2854 [Vigna unguiculata]|uniref:Uncharacterized protein n=1 Tax=Vigna unguiculata TaxID=3917 RepID=A0A4D6L216_VIGUN|nr:hypothetical protein DEO72_LG2g2854 [Vigna unguiculata]